MGRVTDHVRAVVQRDLDEREEERARGLDRSARWQAWPVTVGLLIAAVSGAAAVTMGLRDADRYVRSAVTDMIRAHDDGAVAHGDVRRSVLRCDTELSALRERVSALETAARKQARR